MDAATVGQREPRDKFCETMVLRKIFNPICAMNFVTKMKKKRKKSIKNTRQNYRVSTTNISNLVGPHAGSDAQLLVSDDVNVHDNKLLQLSRVAEAVEWVAPVCVSIHLSN